MNKNNNTTSPFMLTQSVEELYHRTEPTGNAVIDTVIVCLRNTSTQLSSDVAAYLQLEDMSYSVRKLSGCIEIFLGVPLKALIMEWRALQARDLLDNHELTLDEVAHRCGFVQKKSLIDFFSRRFGMTPMVYRTGKVSHHTRYRVNK